MAVCGRKGRPPPGTSGRISPSQSRLIVTGGATATRPAKKATAKIPIVMAQDGDPVGAGFIASQARPGGNITGLAAWHRSYLGNEWSFSKKPLPKFLAWRSY